MADVDAQKNILSKMTPLPDNDERREVGIDSNSSSKPVNTFFVKNLREARRQAAKKLGLDHFPQGSSYSLMLREATNQAIDELAGKNPALTDSEFAVFIKGSVSMGTALPLLGRIEKERLPQETGRILHLIYVWLFTSLGRSSEFRDSRFLDDDLSSTLEIHFFFTDPSCVSLETLADSIEETLVQHLNFSPPIRCRVDSVEQLDLSTIVSMDCITGVDLVHAHLQQKTMAIEDNDLRRISGDAVRSLRDKLLTDWARWLPAEGPESLDAEIVESYQVAQSVKDPLVCLDLMARDGLATTPWHESNKPFFDSLKRNAFDVILVEDATKNLKDSKGEEKENPFTISRVLGLMEKDRLIPAHRMVLKIRGFTQFRGDINNTVDILKEYSSYIYIHSKLKAALGHFLNVGPLLLTCEKLDVPYDSQEKRRWVGFFLEEIPHQDQGTVFTCRVRNVSDFWAVPVLQKRIHRLAENQNVEIDFKHLKNMLRDLSERLWSDGISIDYCDIHILLDESNRPEDLLLFDFERLTFSELVHENHPILDGLIDLKSHLSDEDWYHGLAYAYRSKDIVGGFRSLPDLISRLRPTNPRRVRRLRFLHTGQRVVGSLGESFGRLAWEKFIRFLAIVGQLNYKLPTSGVKKKNDS